MRPLLLAGVLTLSVAICEAQPSGIPPELATSWEAPPGDPLELMSAGFAKILCSAIFITGRDLATATEEDGFFVAPRAERRAVKQVTVDPTQRAIHVTLPNGVTRTAKLFGDHGCITLPRGKDSLFFAPVKIKSSLPEAATQPWPMGDRVADAPLPEELDKAKLAASVKAAFDSPDALTAAFVIAYKGQIIGERYQRGIPYTTPLPGWSMGKSIAATLMGQLIQEGVYDLWQPAPIEQWQGVDDPRRAIRIADLMRMSSGLRFYAPQDPDFDPAKGYPDHLYVYTGASDSAQWTISRPAQWPPNTVGRYRNSDPLAVNYLVKKAVLARGGDYLVYPQQHLFDKLGIRHMVLETDPYGNFLIQGYDLGSGRDWLRLGMLYQQDGVWNGQRLLPEGWVNFVRTPAPAWSRPIYGGLLWLHREQRWPVPQDAYFMAGSGSQFVIIIPTHDLVVVRLGHYKGAEAGERALHRALQVLMDAVPQVRSAWQPSSAQK